MRSASLNPFENISVCHTGTLRILPIAAPIPVRLSFPGNRTRMFNGRDLQFGHLWFSRTHVTFVPSPILVPSSSCWLTRLFSVTMSIACSVKVFSNDLRAVQPYPQKPLLLRCPSHHQVLTIREVSLYVSVMICILVTSRRAACNEIPLYVRMEVRSCTSWVNYKT